MAAMCLGLNVLMLGPEMAVASWLGGRGETSGPSFTEVAAKPDMESKIRTLIHCGLVTP